MAQTVPPALGAEPRLRRTVTWRTGVLLGLGTALLVSVSLGPMGAALGSVSVLVWAGVALVGGLQCLLLAELAARFPDRTGGAGTYSQAAFGDGAPLLGALSNWGYWFAWTPGIAVNLILAAEYLRATLAPGTALLPLVFLLAAGLYLTNFMGLRVSARVAAGVAVVAVLPLLLILAGLALHPELLHAGNLLPMRVADHGWTSWATWALVIQWAFVAAWSAYGAEMACTVVAEMRDPRQRALRMMVVSGVVCFVAFAAVPVLVVMLVGGHGVAEDPTVIFLPAAEAVFGDAGATLIGIMLAAGLVLGAQAFVVGSSRTIFQMTADGYLPRQLFWTNGRGVPVGSLLFDIPLIAALLLIFGTDVVDVVASANVGYVVVFILMPVAYLVMRRRDRLAGRPVPSPRLRTMLAVGLAAFNVVLLVVGGWQWGPAVMGVGLAVLASVVPITLLRRRQESSSA